MKVEVEWNRYRSEYLELWWQVPPFPTRQGAKDFIKLCAGTLGEALGTLLHSKLKHQITIVPPELNLYKHMLEISWVAKQNMGRIHFEWVEINGVTEMT